MTGPQRPFLTPGAGPLRRKVELRSAVLLVFLRRLPRPVPGLLVLGLVATALLLPGPGGALALAAVASVLGWLVFLSWPALDRTGRTIRLVAVALVVAGAAARLTG